MADGKQNLLLSSLRTFYMDPENCKIFLDVIQAQNRYPSLRILDWLGNGTKETKINRIRRDRS